MKDLKNRIALVTGGSRGIGAAVAIALANAGADIAVNYRERADAASAVCGEIAEMGRKAIAVQADVSVAADVKRMVAEAEAHIGGIDILVNNAAIAHPRKLEEITEAEWDEVLTVNLKSVFLVTQAVIGGMRQRKWGRIVNLSSVAAQTGGAVGAHYAASKAGIIGLTHSCASAFIRDGVTVNAIAPALIETDSRYTWYHNDEVLTSLCRIFCHRKMLRMEFFQLHHPLNATVLCDRKGCEQVADYLEMDDHGHEYRVCASHTDSKTHASQLPTRKPNPDLPFRSRPAAWTVGGTPASSEL